MSILSAYQGMESLINGEEHEGGGGENQHVEATEVVLEETRANLAEAVAEVEQLAESAGQLAEELKDQEETVEELVEEVAGMEGLLASGQFSSLAFAQKYNRGLKLNAKLGGQNFSTMGAESISDAATARMASVSGMEGFMESVKAGASKAIEYIKHIFNSVIAFFVGMFNAAAGLEKRQKALLARLKGDVKLREKVKLGSWNIGLDYAAEGLRGLESLASSSMFSIVDGALPAFMELGKNLDGIDASKFKSAYGALIADIKAMAKDVGKVSEKTDSNDKHIVLGARAGFRVFAVFEEKYETEEQMIAAARSIKISFGKTEDAKKFSTGEVTNKVTSKGALESAVNGVKDYVEAIRSSKVQQKFSKAERDRVVATLNVKTKTDGDTKDANNKAIALCKAIFISSSALTMSVQKLYVNLAKQRMDAVQAHI